jgi:hypothetical protein
VVSPCMLASIPASILNQMFAPLGIPRDSDFKLDALERDRLKWKHRSQEARSRFFAGPAIGRKTGFHPRLRGDMLFLIALYAPIREWYDHQAL